MATRVCLCGRAVPPASRSRRCVVHQREWDARRNAHPARAIYSPAWAAESRRRRKAQPWCTACGRRYDLTVDHPTRAVLCRSCHLVMENHRRGNVTGRGEAIRRAVADLPEPAAPFPRVRFP